MKKEPTGTYVCLKMDEDSQKRVARFIELNHIVNGVQMASLHSTVIYSKKHCPNLKVEDIGRVEAKIVKFIQIPHETKIILALETESEEMQKLHKRLRKEHDATHDFDSYLTHVTVAYDALQMPVHPDMSMFEGRPLVFDTMVVEDLNEDWAG
jgi:hypothetical protein